MDRQQKGSASMPQWGRGEALQKHLQRFEEIERMLADPLVLAESSRVRTLAKERSLLMPLVIRYREFQEVESQMRSTREMLDSNESHGELKELAQAELASLGSRLANLQAELENLFLEEDPEGEKSAIMEIRSGTGGLEASLFAADLFRMYSRYAAAQSWKMEPLGMSPTEAGGFKEVIFAVEGEGVFRKLKFERGVHRVQRVPETEASGRIHTSTVTVAVMPQAEEVDIQIDPKDLKIDVFRSSGPGGQSVNTADSAVRITHLPTGIVVSCQDERSQLKNKTKGMKVLRARLLDRKTEEQASQRASQRRAQIGTGDRSEKIRTYNFPDRRVTDHRINFTSHRLEEILNGNLDELLNPLLEAERQAKLNKKKT